MHPITVIVTTAPGREQNLKYCLKALAQQSQPAAQIFVADDGSEHGAEICAQFSELPIEHLWRPNDRSVGRSRNAGATRANNNHDLVFIDGDILLNPQALASHSHDLASQRASIIYGYFGYSITNVSNSLWFPEREVNYIDQRFISYTSRTLLAAPELHYYPEWYGWSGNLCMTQTTFQQLGGFREDLQGWGGEDLYLAAQARTQGIELHFSVNSWGEHQHHSRAESYHKQKDGMRKVFFECHPADYQVKLLAQPERLIELLQAIFFYYLPGDEFVSAEDKLYLRYPEAAFQHELPWVKHIEHHFSNHAQIMKELDKLDRKQRLSLSYQIGLSNPLSGVLLQPLQQSLNASRVFKQNL